MRKISKAVLAAGMAAATIASGLSFGVASATAAPSTKAQTSGPWTSVDGSLVELRKGTPARVDLRFRINVNSSVAAGGQVILSSPAGTHFSSSVVAKGFDRPGSEGNVDCVLTNSQHTLTCGSGGTSGSGYWGANHTWSWSPEIAVDTAAEAVQGSVSARLKGSGSAGSWDLTSTTPVSAESLTADVESVSVPDRTATLKGFAAAGTQVIINDSIPAVVNPDGSWSKTLTGMHLGKQDLKVEQWKNGAQTGDAVTVEADLAVVPLTVEHLFTKNVGDRVKVYGSGQADIDVVLTANGKKYTTPIGSDGTFEYLLPAPNKGGVTTITARQEVPKTGGGSDLTDPVSHDIDYGIGVSVVEPPEDYEHDGGPLEMNGRGQSGATVVVTEKGDPAHILADKEVLSNNTWTLETSELSAAEHTLVVTQKSKGQNVTTAEVVINKGKNNVAVPTGSVAFDADVSEKATASGTGVDGATITLFDDATNKQIGSAPVTGGTWSTPIDALGAGKHTIRVEQSGIEGVQTTTTEADFGVGVDVTSPSAGQVTPGEVHVQGTGQDGAKITVTAGGVTETGTVTGGTFDVPIEVPASKDPIDVTVSQLSKGNLTTTDTVQVTPDGAQQLQRVAIEGPGSYVNGVNGYVTGTATPYASVEVSHQWGVIKTITAGKDGTWGFWRGFGPDVAYTLTAKQTTISGQSSTSDPFTLAPEGADQNAPAVITGPEKGWYDPTSGGNHVTGTAAPNASVEIRSQFGTVKTVPANGSGHWEFYRGFGPNVVYQLTATQTRTDGTTSTSDVFLLKPKPSQTSPVIITGPIDAKYDVAATLLQGIASPGATVQVSSQWGVLDTVTANADGEWFFWRGYGPNVDYTITAVQTRTDGTTTTSPAFTMTPRTTN
ncbi:hypothetical protein DEJ13_02360 [Curtobacterium sp. MCLR17_007]|uniref:hypothetical protein n=1 Tax=Curtobacterium sp. MCLR17_007 TaxID=2175648 RepID=UPI0024DFA653|nr:hypothetical protein [Curtobacterium sp. MCLR17_007]WIB60691.1 hypothetical protein DEJ13_02360 [Curtobacterium sp. MCLR17_007]